jgi:hypothetical protein
MLKAEVGWSLNPINTCIDVTLEVEALKALNGVLFFPGSLLATECELQSQILFHPMQ